MFLDYVVVAFGDLDDAITLDVFEVLDDFRGRPLHGNFLNGFVRTEAKVLPQGILTAVSIAQHHFAHLLFAPDFQCDTGTDGVTVALCANQFHLQPVSLV